MASQYIGVIVGTTTGHVFAVINPDDDSELDNPRHLLLKIIVSKDPPPPQSDDPDAPPPNPPLLPEPVIMVRVPRGKYEGALTMDDVAEIIKQLRADMTIEELSDGWDEKTLEERRGK